MSISSQDAKRDNIRITTEGSEFRKYTAYHIVCDNCGNEYVKRRYNSNDEHLCDKCRYMRKKKIQAKEKIDLEGVQTKNEIKFEKAIEEMKKQVIWNAKYKGCAEVAKKRVEFYGSIPEMMVAIQLLYLGYRITPQQKIGKYRVDFLIPRKKIVLEIDGKIFHAKQNSNREATIQLSLGLDWNIIHIPAELIRNDILKLEQILQHQGKK